MPVNIKNPDFKQMSGQTAEQDYFLDKDGNIAQDEASAATLLIRKGQEMSKDVADKIGNQVAQPEEEAEGDESGKSAKPTANKSAAPTKNKGVKE